MLRICLEGNQGDLKSLWMVGRLAKDMFIIELGNYDLWKRTLVEESVGIYAHGIGK